MNLRCKDCDSIFWEKGFLKAPNPFNPSETLIGCPSCSSVNQTVPTCEYEKCIQDATCGTPTKDGYKRLCGEHYSKVAKDESEKK